MSAPRVSAAERRWLMAASLVVLALASLPYLAGWLAQTPDRVFTGLQVNPLDGLTYLAKMRIGLRGEWLFQLAFTPESGGGALLFTYFVALGHLARLLALPPIVIFHLARLVGGLALLWLIYQLIARLADSIALRRWMWWVAALSSGLGWLAVLLGDHSSSDLSIPESNTFYSLMANAHFALATALMIAVFIGVLETTRLSVRRSIGLAGLSVLLAVIQPFAPFAVYAILGLTLVVRWRRDRVWPRAPFASAVIAGAVTAPLLLYLFLATQADPLLRAWSAQNQTPSPPPPAYLIGYGLLLIAAVPGARAAWRRRSDWDLLLLVWIAVTALLLYAPIPLQRRLSLGLHVPIALLAAWGLSTVLRARWSRRLALAALLPTSLFLVLALIGGAAARDPGIFITGGEQRAFEWLQANARRGAVVLAAPETGAFIPAYTDLRVIYGHPYETVNAAQRRREALDFFAGTIDRAAVLREADYVFVGPREVKLGVFDPTDLPLIETFASDGVTIYAVAGR